jgi:hypothetical protein
MTPEEHSALKRKIIGEFPYPIANCYQQFS